MSFSLHGQSQTEGERALGDPATRAKPAGDPTPPLGLFCSASKRLGGRPVHLLGE
jgi:hypothetical protein